jgi:ankyrin repeat protein
MKGGADDIFHAIEDNNVEEMNLFLEKSKDLNIMNEDDVSVLIQAIAYQRNEFVKLLLEKGANPNLQVTTYKTAPIHVAVGVNNPEIVNLLLKKGADPNIQDLQGFTCLMNMNFTEIKDFNINIAKLLLEKGADPNITNSLGTKAIDYADNDDFISLLLLYGSTPKQINVFDAIARNNEKEMKLFLENSKDFNIMSEDNVSVLNKAILYGRNEFVKLLLEKGANPNLQVTTYKIAPIHVAVGENNPEIVNLLLEKGANPNIQDQQGFTCLMIIAKNKSFNGEIAKLLLEKGAHPNITNSSGKKAIDITDNVDFISLLLLYGSTPKRINIIEITDQEISSIKDENMNDRLNFLKTKIATQPKGQTILLAINRNNAFNDSFELLNKALSGNDNYSLMKIQFIGEQGVDAGGLTKEYFSIVSKELIDPNKNLFYSYDNNNTFQPNFYSKNNENYIEQFKFIGRLVGKAICLGVTLDSLAFTIPFRKHIIGKEIVVEDLQSKICDLQESNSYYNYLKFIKDTDMSFIGEEYKMPVPGRDNKNPEKIYYQSLKENNENETVFNLSALGRVPSEGNGDYRVIVESNKTQFIQDSIKYITTESIKPQIDAFLDGLYSMVPKKFLELFTVEELELLINGSPTVDVDELRTKTKYVDYEENDDVIQWLWEILKNETQEFRKKFLKFVTGSSRIGVDFKLTIQKIYGSELYPAAHTCFNQLDLPMYISTKELNEKLSLAINSEGFGMA